MAVLVDVVAGGSFDLAPVVEECLEAQGVRDLSARSLAELRLHLGALVGHCASSRVTSIEELTPRFLKGFVESFADRDSPALTKAVVWSLRTFGGYCAVVGYLPSNPARSLSYPRISRRRKLPDYLKAHELARVMEHCACTEGLREITVVALLATTGLRPHEVCRLRRGDIDLGRRSLRVLVKGNWYKRMPLSDAMADTLQDYCDEHPDRVSPLFVNNWGRPINVHWIRRLVVRLGRGAGIDHHVCPRMLRHTFGTYMAERNGKPVTRALLGHGSNAATDVYMHLAPRAYRKSVNRHAYGRQFNRGQYL